MERGVILEEKAADFFKNLFICSKIILEKERKTLRCCGLSLSDYLILSSVYETQDLKMTDIAKEIFVSRPVATYAVDRLVRRGLIKRSRSKDRDRRIVLLEMTPKVGFLIKSIREKQRLLLKNGFSELPDHVRKLVSAYFPQIRAFSGKDSCKKRKGNKVLRK